MRRELEVLRQRVAELQRRAAGHRDADSTRFAGTVAVTISAREQLLLESERLSHVGSWVWDLDTNSVFWSDELYRILGYESTRDAATTEAFFARVHPDDRERIRSLAAQSAASGFSHQVDFRLLRPDGQVRHATMGGAMMFDGGGTLRRMVGSVRDLTEERSAREHLARANQLLEEAQGMAHLGSWVLDARTGVREWTPELFRIMGIPDDTPVTAELFPSLLHPDDRARMLAQRQRAIEEGTSGESELRVVRHDGEVRHVRFQTAARVDEQGNTVELRGTVLDITEQVLLRQRLANAQKMEAIGRLAGGIAHDFNNLLMVMGINLDIWVKGLAAPPAELRDVQRALSSARALVQRLLAFGRKAELDRRVVDPNDLVDRTLELLRRVMGDRVTLVR
jgi:two-component system cell cycle sensor histidine kinase/response regulator CckA